MAGSYQSWSPNTDNERTINLYAEAVESAGGKNKIILHGTPGLTLFTTLPTSPVRCLWAGEERLFAVGGSELYEISAAGALTSLGNVGDDADHTPVSIWPNGHEIMIVSAGQIYIHNGVSLIEPIMREGEGTADTFGNDVILWKSGDKFSPSLADPGHTITMGGTTYNIVVWQNPETIKIDENAPTHTDTPFTVEGVIRAKTGTYLDSYFIVNPPDSKTFYFSQPNDGVGYDPVTGVVTGWDGLEVSVKEGYPDNIAAVYSDHEELWLFGTHWSTEVWRNEGDPNMPGGFRRDPGAFIHMACIAPWSIASLASGLHWLGSDTRGGTVAYRAQGFQPVRVSTHAIEQLWNKYTRVDDAYAYTYLEHGHQFWVLNFMTANATWVYDVASQLWHERAYWNGTALEKHRGRCHAYVCLNPAGNQTGKHYVGDHTNGKIYQMSQEFFTDAGTEIRRIRQAPHLSNSQLAVFHHRFQLDLDITGTTPQVILDWSNDDGDTWSAQKPKSPSMTGRKGRVIWNRNGSARDRIYRVMVKDPVKVAITDALVDVTPGTS